MWSTRAATLSSADETKIDSSKSSSSSSSKKGNESKDMFASVFSSGKSKKKSKSDKKAKQGKSSETRSNKSDEESDTDSRFSSSATEQQQQQQFSIKDETKEEDESERDLYQPPSDASWYIPQGYEKNSTASSLQSKKKKKKISRAKMPLYLHKRVTAQSLEPESRSSGVDRGTVISLDSLGSVVQYLIDNTTDDFVSNSKHYREKLVGLSYEYMMNNPAPIVNNLLSIVKSDSVEIMNQSVGHYTSSK